MKIGTCVLSIIGFALCLGCESKRERAIDHEKSARDKIGEARQELREGAEEARQELSKGKEEAREAWEQGKEKAREQIDDAKEEQAKARDDWNKIPAEERSPVAGRETSMEKELRDELGDGWVVETKAMGGFLAVRKKPTRADDNINAKVAEEIKDLRDDFRATTATYKGGEVLIRGEIDNCEKIDDTIDDFAKIDGVNRIRVDLNCPMTTK